MANGVKILCVDDEMNVLRALERIFLDTDYEIFTAISGLEGLEILKNEQDIQLIISDYRMPEMNGVEFLREAREHWPDTIRIVLSGFADTASIVDAINEGQIYKFVPKPWNDDELKVTISTAVAVYALHKKNMELTEELTVSNLALQTMNDNLEKLVDERTDNLMFQVKALQRNQNILNSLPVAVLGIDPDGMIVQDNKKWIEFAGKDQVQFVGSDRFQVLSAELNNFIDDVIEKKTHTSFVSISGNNVKVAGLLMQFHDGQEGVVLVVDEVDIAG